MLRPTTRGGLAISTRGSFAARVKSASALIWMPGAMTPPAYSPRDVTTSKVVSQRGDVVHGAAADPSVDQAALVVEWADQMRTQLTLRLIASTTHPLHDLFVAFFDMAKQAQGGEQGATGSAPTVSA